MKLTTNNLSKMAEKSLKVDRRPEYLRQSTTRHGRGSAQRFFPYYNFLYMLARKLRPQLIVELGTGAGTGCLNLKKGNPSARVITIGKFPFRNRHAGITYAVAVDSSRAIPTLPFREIGILFIDTTHEHGQVKKEFEKYSPLVKGVVLVVGISANDGMREFWNTISFPKIDLSQLHPTVGFGAAVRWCG